MLANKTKPLPMCQSNILSVSDETGKNQATDHMEMGAKLPFILLLLAVYSGTRNETMISYGRKWLH